MKTQCKFERKWAAVAICPHCKLGTRIGRKRTWEVVSGRGRGEGGRKLVEEGIKKDALTEIWALWLLQKCDVHKVTCALLQADKGRTGTEVTKVTCAILSS